MTTSNTSQPSPPDLLVPAAQRYHAAWQEINARVQARQVIQGMYMTGVVVTLLLGLVPNTATWSSPLTWNTAVALVLPVLTLAVGLWVRHNDATIGLLSAFCQFLERYDDPSQTGLVPGWHDTRYHIIDRARRFRALSDVAFALVGLLGTIPAFALTFPGLWQAASSALAISLPLLPLLASALGASGIALVLRNGALRRDIKDNWVFGADGEGHHRWGARGVVRELAKPQAHIGPNDAA